MKLEISEFEVVMDDTEYVIGEEFDSENGKQVSKGWYWYSADENDQPKSYDYYATPMDALAAAIEWEEEHKSRNQDRRDAEEQEQLGQDDEDRRYGSYEDQVRSQYYGSVL